MEYSHETNIFEIDCRFFFLYFLEQLITLRVAAFYEQRFYVRTILAYSIEMDSTHKTWMEDTCDGPRLAHHLRISATEPVQS